MQAMFTPEVRTELTSSSSEHAEARYRNAGRGSEVVTPRPGTAPAVMESIRAYGLAVLAIAIATGLALLGDLQGLYRIPTPLFLIAIAVAVWYGGRGPGAVAVVLATLGFDYFFTVPRF